MTKKLFLPIYIFLLFGFLLFDFPALADTLILDTEEKEISESRLVLPYPLANEVNGLFLGLAAGVANRGGDTAIFGGTAAYSTKDAGLVALLAKDMQMPWAERLFVDFLVYRGRYNDLQAYVNGNPEFIGRDSGSNDSDKDNFLEGKGSDTLAEVVFKYVLPIGHGRAGAVHTYTLSDGLLYSGASGGESWNPLKSGRTFLKLRYFYRHMELEESAKGVNLKTNGLMLTATYDNRDLPVNPERGSLLNLQLARDIGWFDSTDSWTVVQGDYSKYFSLGESSWSRQQVLSLNVWTADTPSWEETTTSTGIMVSHRPPFFKGANLGGFNRLRAYPFYRYHDRAAVHYNAEYRFIPAGKPFLADSRLMKKYKLKWWQLVAFAEAGRVADSWSLDELHSDMKWDVGVGLRTMLAKTIFRLDLAVAEESFGLWAMVGQVVNF